MLQKRHIRVIGSLFGWMLKCSFWVTDDSLGSCKSTVCKVTNRGICCICHTIRWLSGNRICVKGTILSGLPVGRVAPASRLLCANIHEKNELLLQGWVKPEGVVMEILTHLSCYPTLVRDLCLIRTPKWSLRTSERDTDFHPSSWSWFSSISHEIGIDK